ncbi:MAG TPA: response regulator transcription factor [Myxococcota bacterium]|nr:response regulator transcription factor [Myxococcota bacterium]
MKRILLIEDDLTLALSLRLALTAYGHQVEVAHSLAAAREKLATRPDILLLDLGLPDGDGLDLVIELRKKDDITPIIALTARGTLTDRVDGLQKGLDDYVTKPFDLPELVARVEALLRRHSWARPSSDSLESATVGRLFVDFRTHEATCDGAAVSLSDLEVRFLKYLIDRAGLVVNREELLTEVWALPAQSRTRSLDTFVYRLRRLIEQDPASPTILKSVRGAGWRLCPGGVPEPD